MYLYYNKLIQWIYVPRHFKNMSYHETSKLKWLSTQNRKNLIWEFYPNHIHILMLVYFNKHINSDLTQFRKK